MAEKKTTSKRSTKGPAKPRAATTANNPGPHANTECAMSVPSDEEVARKAYALWENRGKPFGSPDEDWYKAQKELGSHEMRIGWG